MDSNREMQKTEHYYECYGKRYENMKVAREALDMGTRAFRNKVKNGTFRKISPNDSQHGQYSKRQETKR